MRRIGGFAVVLAVLVTACTGSDGQDASGDADSSRGSTPVAVPGQDDGCTWPMAGQNLARTHATACPDPGAVGGDTLDRLEQVWFTETRAEVTGAPAVTEDALYLGDWSGRVYSLDRSTGEIRWSRDLPTHPQVYAGQITASPTVAPVDGRQAVVVASGRTVHVLDAETGNPVWDRVLGYPDDPDDPTEIQGSPAVTDDLVIVPTDVHNDPDRRSGVVALSLADGSTRWTWDPEEGGPSGGCGSIWGSPAVDPDSRMVVVGTGNCGSDDVWNPYSEAVVGLDLDDGTPQWSYQPHERGNDRDWDFAGAANLYEIDGRAVAGLGNKDGTYYVVDRTNGELVWKSEAQRQASGRDGFAFGGFIGATALAPDDRGTFVVAGGTALGDCPCEHAFDAGTGAPAWQNDEPTGTYGASAAAGGVVFSAGIDQTLRAFDLRSGETMWDRPLSAISASGPAIAGDFLAIGVGFREPGGDGSASGGVHGFRVLEPDEAAPTSAVTTVPEGPAVTALAPADQACVGTPCLVPFTLKSPPTGRTPTMTLEITPDPLRISVRTTDLGPPEAWLRPGGTAERDGATVYAVFITPRDDRPELGSVVCVLDKDGACTGDRIDVPAPGYTRISLLALVDADTPPTVQEGFDRLVTTQSFDPALAAKE